MMRGGLIRADTEWRKQHTAHCRVSQPVSPTTAPPPSACCVPALADGVPATPANSSVTHAPCFSLSNIPGLCTPSSAPLRVRIVEDPEHVEV